MSKRRTKKILSKERGSKDLLVHAQTLIPIFNRSDVAGAVLQTSLLVLVSWSLSLDPPPET